ncbi:hypothetical protein [Conexibacter sp. SYSU D00693]|uniref:hypothetical protein n=1 Tax=Conexibacter sp. SYSU D00693 TaxID=2812560 RepID=UPI00196B2346|nr:hypothetical protein [Conexibacter sp. SYSU D00693]
MRFADLLRATVLLSAAAGTTLAVLTVAGATRVQDDALVLVCTAWWAVAGLLGGWLGRGAAASEATATAMATARAQTTLPELRPGVALLNRLWPLLALVVAAGVVALWVPQVAGVATGFLLLWSLLWRRQEAAVRAVEDRDGATFYVERTSPFEPVKLVRVPGFRREVPTQPAEGV